ncbi:MAG: arginine--tRNA ligase [Treponema sp.]|nr:arginine--tRNA ligase [Treponema sp.]
MADKREVFQKLVLQAVNQYKKEKSLEGDEITIDSIHVENPPKPEMGDFGIPMFMFAKAFRSSPMAIAQEVAKITAALSGASELGSIEAAGPYVNVKLNKASAGADILLDIIAQGESYGSKNEDGKAPLEGQKVMIEYSSPNTNKPLHLGHLRNDALGESVSRILKKAGAEVYRVNIINNRGVHICKSMLAYKLFHEKNNDTPESLGMKGDHFVGQCYVEFDRYAKEHPEANDEAQAMLEQWEKGTDDDELHILWKKMNGWALDGVQATYKRTGVGFEKLYFESETYLKGKDEILKGLEKGIFFKAEDGSVRIDVTEATGKGKDGTNQEKVLLRKDGTSVYITQDIGTAISRHNDWAFNQLVYVVASEQIYHFKVLFYILKKLGFDWAEKLHHLSYGLVNLPSGRMKSREGTIVDADDLIDSLHEDARKAIEERGRDEEVGNADEVAEKVALAALHYYLLQVNPVKDMLFNPAESLSFNGNTGPYLQYMGARIASILRKAQETGLEPAEDRDSLSLLTHESEWELIKALQRFPKTVAYAAQNFDPSAMAIYIYDVSKAFSSFYRDCPIMSIAESEAKLAKARLSLAKCTHTVLKNAMDLVLVPYLDRM